MSKLFNSAEREAICSVIHERRDMRHFSGGTVEAKVLARILDAAHAAPSVGFMQPWRFVRITKLELREQLIALVDGEKQRTSNEMDGRKAEFMRLKVERIRDCAELMAVVPGENLYPINHKDTKAQI